MGKGSLLGNVGGVVSREGADSLLGNVGGVLVGKGQTTISS